MMEKERKINWLKLILAFLIASFLFFIGMFLGFLAKGIIEKSTIDIEESTRNEIANLETINLIDQDSSCSSLTLDLVSEKLDYLGDLITTLEVKKGKYDRDVLELKKLYTNLEVRHMFLVNEENKKCASNNTVIMFFYSNSEECKGSVEKDSFIITYLRNKHDSLRVYSYDIDLSSDIISILKKKYSVRGCQTIVVNGNSTLSNIENSQDFEKFLFS